MNETDIDDRLVRRYQDYFEVELDSDRWTEAKAGQE
jgi:hypothetical protein